MVMFSAKFSKTNIVKQNICIADLYMYKKYEKSSVIILMIASMSTFLGLVIHFGIL